MKELTDFDTQRMHMQMHGKANFKDVVRFRELQRTRRINEAFWFLAIVFSIMGFVSFKIGFTQAPYYFFGLGALFFIILIFRYGVHKKLGSNKIKQSEWERIDKLPDWAYRKMKKKRKNRVNGEHYVYKREGSNFYKKLR